MELMQHGLVGGEVGSNLHCVCGPEIRVEMFKSTVDQSTVQLGLLEFQ